MSLPVSNNYSPNDNEVDLYTILANQARSQPDKVYLYGADGSMTYQQMEDIAFSLGRTLQGRLDPQRLVVGASLDSGTAVIQLVWGCLSAGICLAFLPLTPDPEEISALMAQIGVDLLVTDVPELQEEPWAVPFATLMQQSSASNGVVDNTAVSSETPAFIFQTSGTTGAAKWIQVTHGQYLRAIAGMCNMGCLAHAANQTVYLTSPLSHSYGLSRLLEYSSMAAAVVLPATGSAMGPLGDLLQARFTSLLTAIEGVPHFYAQMARFIKRINLPNLQHIGFGGGALDLEAVRQIRQVYPALSYSVRYGLTETPSVVSHKLFAPPYADDWQSSGKVLPIYTLRIVDEAGDCVPAGAVGEIHLQGESLAWPYYGETAVSDFFPTGDIGYIDANTQELHIVGRKSAFLKVRGYRLSPEHIEAIIGAYAGVADCRVSGTETGILAEVVPVDGTVAEPALLAHLAHKLPSYAIPETITFVSAIPRTHSGKIKRH